MTDVVTDIDRPDTNGTKPLMTQLCQQVTDRLEHLDVVRNVTCSDNFLSTVTIWGTFDPENTWAGGYYLNSRHFRFGFVTGKDKRYYSDGDKVTVELDSSSHKIPAHLRKFRKYTGAPEKVIAKVEAWILAVTAEVG